MEDDEAIDHAGLDRPLRLFAKDRDVVHAGGPGHHPLRSGHQPDHTARRLEIGPQKRHREAEARDRLSLGGRPEGRDLVADRLLGHAAELRAVIEVPQVENVEMHCARGRPWAKSGASIRKRTRIAMPLEIVTVPCLKDNYAFLAHDAATGATAVVIPTVPTYTCSIAVHQLSDFSDAAAFTAIVGVGGGVQAITGLSVNQQYYGYARCGAPAAKYQNYGIFRFVTR